MARLASARSLLVTVWGDTIRPRADEIGAAGVIGLMAPLGLSPRAVRTALARMTRQGWLRRRRTGRRAFYALTPAGALRLEQGVRRVYETSREPWDRKWRVFTYVIPEERRAVRDRLRRELVWLGLGPLSRSTWITTRVLASVLLDMSAARGLDGSVALFEARHLGPRGDRALVERCWDLEAIGRRYRRFIASLRPRAAALRRRVRAGAIADAACFAEKIRLVHEYRKFLFVDPGLPDDLLPARRPALEAAALFHRTYAMLAPRANRFVARVIGPALGRSLARDSRPSRRTRSRSGPRRRGRDDDGYEPACDVAEYRFERAP